MKYPYKKRRIGHRETHQGLAYTDRRPCEKKARRYPFTSPGKKPQEKPTLPAP